MEFLLIPLGIALGVVVVAYVGYRVISNKINRFVRRSTGMTVNMISSAIREGMREGQPAEQGLRIQDLSSVYEVQIKRVFPDMSIKEMKTLAQTGFMQTLACLETASIEPLKVNSGLYRKKLMAEIDENLRDNIRLDYENIVVRAIGISGFRYNKREATAVFDIAAAYKLTDSRKSRNAIPCETHYRVTLAYNQAEHEASTSSLFSSTCPSCGAPAPAIGENGKELLCEYCGSGIATMATRIWQIGDVVLVKCVEKSAR